MAHENIKFRQFGIILFLSIAISSPWWLEITIEVLERPYLILLSDAGKDWIECSFLTEMIIYYRFIPIFSFIGVIYIIKNSMNRIFLFLWIILISILLFTPWGGRFALELAIPLYMLGAVGISQIIRWAISKKNEWLAARLAVLAFMFAVLCDSIRLLEIARNIFIQRLL